MRTTIDVDEDAIREAQGLSASRMKNTIGDTAIETSGRCVRERAALKMFGKLQWDGDLGASRESRATAGLVAPVGEVPAVRDEG